MSLTNAMSAGARRPEEYVYAASRANAMNSGRSLLEPAGVLAAAEAQDVEHRLDADELQRDVRHRREDAGERDREPQRLGVEPALDEVGRRHVAATVRDRPQPRQEDEDDRVQDDRVRHGEEADRVAGVEQSRHGDERVRRVDVAADQEPGDERAEVAAAQTPLVEGVEVGGAPPACRQEAHDGDEQEEEQEDTESATGSTSFMRVASLSAEALRGAAIMVVRRRRGGTRSPVSTTETTTSRNWYQKKNGMPPSSGVVRA